MLHALCSGMHARMSANRRAVLLRVRCLPRSSGRVSRKEAAPQGRKRRRVLLRFERTLSRALDGGRVDPLWAGPSTTKQFVRLVEDLVWALTRPAKINSQQSPIAWFAVDSFPHGRYRLGPAVDHCLSITTVQWRRTLLAAVSCLLAGPELRRVMVNDLWTQIRGTSLADLAECLVEPFRDELRIRSLHWPPKPRTMLGERFRIKSTH